MILLDSTYDSVSAAPSDVLALNKKLLEQDQLLSKERTTLRRQPPILNITEDTGSGKTRVYLDKNLRTVEGVSEEIIDIRKPEYALEHWLVQAHAYREQEAAKLGIFSSLFGGDAKRVKGGVIHDAKRFSFDTTSADRKCEVGVAIRLSVATSELTADVKLTIPSLAAEAQLSGKDTRVGISVIGYKGHLGDLLPAPKKLDVETYVEYINAFNNIQKLIFGETGWPNVAPTVLSYGETNKPTV